MRINFHPSLKDILVSVAFLLTAAVLVMSGLAAWEHFRKTPPYVDPQKFPVAGIDVSAHNGAIDFNKVKADGIDFVFIKATEGSDFRDTRFNENYAKARRAGLKTGAYHFFRFDRDGVEQAQNLLSALGGKKPELGVAIDVEKHGNVEGVDSTLIADRLIRMTEFLNLVGYRVTLYSNRDGYLDYIQKSVPGANLWICSFSPNPGNLEWTFWQYDHHGKVNGIEGDVDRNVFYGSRQEWNNFLEGAQWPYDRPPYRPAEPDSTIST